MRLVKANQPAMTFSKSSSSSLSRWYSNFASKLRALGSYAAGSLLFSALATHALPHPAAAAERVTLTYGLLEISTTVEALRAYAEQGEVDEELAPYLKFLSESQQMQVRSALQQKQDISPVEISQFFYSSIGDNILRFMGDIVQTQGRRDGSKGLRGALILAAAEPEGLSLLGIMEQFPTNTMRIDTVRAFRAYESFTGLIRNTEDAIAAIERQSALAEQVAGTTGIGNLSQPGPYAVETQFLRLVDDTRNRVLPTDLYLPAGREAAPLVLISHGLAGDRKGFVALAEHLTSHGYVVAALDHPDSNTDQLLSLFRGTDREIAEPTEFTERPADVSYVIDELLRRTQPNSLLANRIDAAKTGVIGHSFGGYTALALAGAQLNYDHLQKNCESNDFIFNAANPSMLLQCTALAAPEQFTQPVHDERIKAVITFNPVTSSLFGAEGFSQIQIPSLMVAGSRDPVAPALLEQIYPFTWLNPSPESPDHFLALIEGGSHLYDAPALAGTDLALGSELVNADPALAHSYLNALSLGFFEAELEQDLRYKQALQNASILQLGRQPLPLFVVDALTEAMLEPVETDMPTPEIPVVPDMPATDMPAPSSHTL
ncbi:MAG: alpha/beta hydrolase [Cyanobacteria bacterium P01_D01_bin.105]